MIIPASGPESYPDLYVARILAGMGVPIFRCRLDDNGNPAGALGWQNTEAGESSYRAIDRWKPGWGLGAVTGAVLDVVDVDPRNGGADSWPLLLDRLRDDPPLIYGITATPSRGSHFWIPAQRITTKLKILPGIDLKACGGFVFIAPTMRPSKAAGDNGALRPYKWIMPIHPEGTPWYPEPSAAFRELPWDTEARNGTAGPRRGRRDPQELQRSVLAAEAGEQRTALLLLVEHYEMKGIPPEGIRDTLRNFLPTVPAYIPDDPWYPARGGNPDKHINSLIDKYRDGTYWRKHKRTGRLEPIIPDATEDELEGIREVEPNVIHKEDPEETAFWESRPILRHIYDWSRARLSSPWAVLGEAMAEAVCHTPPSFRLPHTIVGGEGTLNMLIAIVGKSGSGKNAAAKVARAAFKWDGVMGIIDKTVPRIPLGSGEGLAKSFGFNQRDKETGQTELVRTYQSVIVTIPEIDTFSAINARSGATISPELRKLYSGETLGFGWADLSKRVIIPEHEYRSVVIAGVQPGRGEAILNDIDGGFAQRWLWLPAIDPSAPDTEVTDPPVIEWEPPGLIPDLAYSDGPHIMKVFDGAAREMRAARLRELRGLTDDMESHALYTRLKVAAGLALLDGSDRVRQDDWDLAGFIMRISNRTRAGVQKHLTQKAHKANIAAGEAEGVRREVADSTAQRQINTKIAIKAMEVLKDGEWTGFNAIRRAVYQGYREHLRNVLDMLIDLGKIESRSIKHTNGQTGIQYRKSRG